MTASTATPHRTRSLYIYNRGGGRNPPSPNRSFSDPATGAAGQRDTHPNDVQARIAAFLLRANPPAQPPGLGFGGTFRRALDWTIAWRGPKALVNFGPACA
jgi:hypothetical protein